jgi:hypothetical protein
MDANSSCSARRSCPRRRGSQPEAVRTALRLSPAACPPASCDTGRAAAGRAGSFNSGTVVMVKIHNPSSLVVDSDSAP